MERARAHAQQRAQLRKLRRELAHSQDADALLATTKVPPVTGRPSSLSSFGESLNVCREENYTIAYNRELQYFGPEEGSVCFGKDIAHTSSESTIGFTLQAEWHRSMTCRL